MLDVLWSFGAFRNLDSVQQFALISSHRNFVSSHESFLDFRSNADSLRNTAAGPSGSVLSLSLRRGAFRFQYLLLNSFKDILNHPVAAHGMKIECFFPFHPSTREKTFA